MATMKENITNALSWFYDKLKKNDLDPIQEEIDELNSNLTKMTTFQWDRLDTQGSFKPPVEALSNGIHFVQYLYYSGMSTSTTELPANAGFEMLVWKYSDDYINIIAMQQGANHICHISKDTDGWRSWVQLNS